MRTAGVGCGSAGSFPGATVLAAWQTFLSQPWVSGAGTSTLCLPARPLHPAEGQAGATAGARVVAAATVQPPGREVAATVASGGSPSSSCGCLPLGCGSER